ncbi:MAG: MerR family transcriptional regulator [Bacteroidota bacterium]|nr:MerR family transcriptional regulator [Bacteroidota bacterium]
MGVYSIKELEILTGIKAHTIRIWEQRYNIIAPNRSNTNIRSYSDEELKYLLNVSLLNKNGHKISKIAIMTQDEVKEAVFSISDFNLEYNAQIDALTISMIDLDELTFEKLLATNILRIGFENTFIKIIFPFMQKVGLLWQTGIIKPTQEHFITNLIRQKIVVAVDGIVLKYGTKMPKAIVYLPEKELHENSLLFMNYMMRKRNIHTLYLGASVPLDDLIATHYDYKPDFLVTLSVAQPAEISIQDYLNKLYYHFPDTPILISGRQVIYNPILPHANLVVLKTIEESIHCLNEIISQFALTQSINTAELNHSGEPLPLSAV